MREINLALYFVCDISFCVSPSVFHDGITEILGYILVLKSKK